VPDGEPTLDIDLGKAIKMIKPLGLKVAVISNASLMWDESVREDLYKADLVSLKVDTVNKDIWKRINRPHRDLKLNSILQGIFEFSQIFKGILITETMLIKGLNDSKDEILKAADYIAGLAPARSYISIPTRPPSEKWVKPASESGINMAYQIFTSRLIKSEYLIGYEGNEFASTGKADEDLLSITSVHPMREEGMEEFLKKAHAQRSLLERLIKDKKLIKLDYNNKSFYVRRFPEVR
jgi:wyosine [tRNA(Phe)-imidazoG37] synthetase (radical SAM superfamily)